MPGGKTGTVCYADPQILWDPLGPNEVAVIADNTTYMETFNKEDLKTQGPDPAVCDPDKCGHGNAEACI
jgi:hypothetical protein